VLAELVRRLAQHADTQNGEFAVTGRQGVLRHHVRGEHHPPLQQSRMVGERGEDVQRRAVWGPHPATLVELEDLLGRIGDRCDTWCRHPAIFALNARSGHRGGLHARHCICNNKGACICRANPVRFACVTLRYDVFDEEKASIHMTKAELIDAVAKEAGVSKADAERTVSAFFTVVTKTAKKGDKVAWPGFGSFSTSKSKARTGRNPQTGAAVKIAASTRMKFTASSTLKAVLNPKKK
jgi:DNA-binding protein HU-beta